MHRASVESEARRGLADANVAMQDRSSCPPDEQVRALAAGKFRDDAILVDHVNNCEWCRREYRDHDRDIEFNKFIGLSTKLAYVVILAIIIVAVFRSCS